MASRHSNASPADSYESQLPYFEVKRDGDRYEVTCPRCEDIFWVRLFWRRSRKGYIGRSCPYCFAVSRLPRRFPRPQRRS